MPCWWQGCSLRTSVAKSEAGGITQRVSGGPLELPSVRLTCIDTPGHAAFFSMRERGASATDIVLLVVSAEEGVRPQTEECVRLLKQKKTDSGLKVVVAATKMDKPGASFERFVFSLASGEAKLATGDASRLHVAASPCISHPTGVLACVLSCLVFLTSSCIFRVKKELAALGIVSDEDGGDVPVSW